MIKTHASNWLNNAILVVLIIGICIYKVEGQFCTVPADCNDNNPCTEDDCVFGSCVNTGICTITLTLTGTPSASPIPTSGPGASVSSTPFGVTTPSSTTTPNVVISTISRSPVPVAPSSASTVPQPSASATGGVPSSFPIQSNTASFVPSSTISTTETRTPTRTLTSPPSQTSAPVQTTQPSLTPTASIASITPSSTSVPATPLPFRVGEPVTVLVQLECASGSCCSNFTGSWATLVAINDVSLMDLLTCDAVNSNLISVTYNQFGSNFYYATEILNEYWVLGGCGAINPFSDGPCFPQNGLLSSTDWENVIELNILSGEYISTLTTNYSTDDYTYITLPGTVSTSSAFLLIPSLIVLLSFFLL